MRQDVVGLIWANLFRYRETGQMKRDQNNEAYIIDRHGSIPAKTRCNIDPDHKRVVQLAARMERVPGTYVFLGPYRTGKSTLAASISTRWTKGHAYWTDTYTMIREIRSSLNQ
jgi:DNA replication protein DnaC